MDFSSVQDGNDIEVNWLGAWMTYPVYKREHKMNLQIIYKSFGFSHLLAPAHALALHGVFDVLPGAGLANLCRGQVRQTRWGGGGG